jgi:hypothetical protein
VVGAVVVLSLLPNFVPVRRVPGAWAISSAFGWSIPHVSDGFVADPAWTRVIRPGSTVLVLPTADRTSASYWEAETGMRFRLAVPATPFVPPKVAASPVVSELVDDFLPSHADPLFGAARLRAFLLAHHVADVVVTSAEGQRWRTVVRLATSSRPVPLASTEVYRVPAGLRPLRVRDVVHFVRASPQQAGLVSRSRAGRLAVWLSFDGLGAGVHAQVDREPASVVSAPGGDASFLAGAVDDHGRAAVAFVEWRDRHALLRVAAHSGRGWRVTTLARSSQPIWSPRVALFSDGGAVAVWVEERDPFRVIRSATLSAEGAWQRPVTLETAANLDSVDLAATGNRAECTWLDAVVSERRVRAAALDDGRWDASVTVTSTLDPLYGAELTGPHASVLEWVAGSGAARPVKFEAHRVGTSWTDAEQIRRADRS